MGAEAQHRSATRGRRYRSTAARATLLLAALALTALALTACGDDGEDGAAPDTDPTAALPAEARRGAEVARDQGCTACHSTDGRDAVGPTWQGLHGSTVELSDGSEVLADDEYLTRAIQEPNAEIRAGFRGIMPERRLEPDQLDAVLAYLRAIGSDA